MARYLGQKGSSCLEPARGVGSVIEEDGMRETPLVLSVPEGGLRSSERKVVTVAVLSICLLFAVAMPAQQQAIAGIADSKGPILTTFEAPGAGTGAGQGTHAESINAAAVISGSYADSNNTSHGFVRAKDGTITTYDAPGAGTGAGVGTYGGGINTAGAIAG